MSKTFEGMIDHLSKTTGYCYDFLVDRYMEIVEEDGDVEQFMNVTMEHDW